MLNLTRVWDGRPLASLGVTPNNGTRVLTANDFLTLVPSRRGHFRMESGYHADLWLELDALFARPAAIAPFLDALAKLVRPHDVDAICGPFVGGAFVAFAVAERLGVECWYAERASDAEGAGTFRARYAIPPAFAARAAGKRVAVVDDAISAGSSVRATIASLEALGASIVCVGTLLCTGDVGREHFAARRIPVVSVASTPFAAWPPDACPLCATNVPLEDVAPVPPLQ